MRAHVMQVSEVQCVAVRCSALQCVAVRCSALQCRFLRFLIHTCHVTLACVCIDTRHHWCTCTYKYLNVQVHQSRVRGTPQDTCQNTNSDVYEGLWIQGHDALPHTATCFSTPRCNALQRTAMHCNALQRTATHCNALQRTATR